jgi:hypothetical protein
MKYELIFAMMLSLLWIESAFAEPIAPEKAEKRAELVVQDISASEDDISFDLMLLQSPLASPTFTAEESESKRSLRVKATPIPVNLWVFADTARLCGMQKFDLYLATLLQQIPKAFDDKSLGTFVSYTASTRDILANHKPISELANTRVTCDAKKLSGSYEESLLRVMDTAPTSPLPTKIWVFTSGNITLSDKTLRKLRSANTDLQVFLYNPGVEAEISSMIETQKAALGSDRIRFTTLRRGDAIFPARYYEAEARFPRELRGRSLGLKLTANALGQEQGTLTFAVSSKGTRGLSFETVMWTLLYLGVTLGILYSVWNYYRPRYCPDCQRRVRANQGYCLFCAKEGDGFIVAPSVLKGPDAKPRLLILKDGVTELGTHRRSLVRLMGTAKPKRTCFLRIVRERVGAERFAYKLVRTSGLEQVDIHLNGLPITRNRYLATGDVITINSTPLTFFMKRSSNHESA